MFEVLVCDRLYTQSRMSLFGSQKGISSCRNDGVQRRSQQQCEQFLQLNERHLQFTEISVFTLVSDTVQEFIFETRNTKSYINNQ